MSEIKVVGVLGAGTMGNGIAHIFARSGFKVWLYDVEQTFLNRGIETIRKNLGREVAKGRLCEEDIEEALGNITGALDLNALAACDFVVEAATERFEIKRQIFSQLDELLPPH